MTNPLNCDAGLVQLRQGMCELPSASRWRHRWMTSLLADLREDSACDCYDGPWARLVPQILRSTRRASSAVAMERKAIELDSTSTVPMATVWSYPPELFEVSLSLS